MSEDFKIYPFKESDRFAVIQLWNDCGLVTKANSPQADIDRKMAHSPDCFLIARTGRNLAGTVMGGYDGHRGWINYLAVDPKYQGKKLGQILMEEIEKRLAEIGCPKINLQVRHTNNKVLGFYQSLGYSDDKVTGLGKRLLIDVASDAIPSADN